ESSRGRRKTPPHGRARQGARRGARPGLRGAPQGVRGRAAKARRVATKAARDGRGDSLARGEELMEPTAKAKKRINTRAKGKRSVKRTRDWLEGQGYVVESLERTTRFRGRQGGKTHDVFGADLIARNEREILFVQVKSNPADFASGVRELEKGPWP